jgi:hypothetical protein
VWSRVSVASHLAAVDVQSLAGDEACSFQVEDPIHDVGDLAHPPQGVYGGVSRVGGRVDQRCLDDTEGDGVHSNSPRCVFDR